jgi:hypothetical protein
MSYTQFAILNFKDRRKAPAFNGAFSFGDSQTDVTALFGGIQRYPLRMTILQTAMLRKSLITKLRASNKGGTPIPGQTP